MHNQKPRKREDKRGIERNMGKGRGGGERKAREEIVVRETGYREEREEKNE